MNSTKYLALGFALVLIGCSAPKDQTVSTAHTVPSGGGAGGTDGASGSATGSDTGSDTGSGGSGGAAGAISMHSAAASDLPIAGSAVGVFNEGDQKTGIMINPKISPKSSGSLQKNFGKMYFTLNLKDESTEVTLRAFESESFLPAYRYIYEAEQGLSNSETQPLVIDASTEKMSVEFVANGSKLTVGGMACRFTVSPQRVRVLYEAKDESGNDIVGTSVQDGVKMTTSCKGTGPLTDSTHVQFISYGRLLLAGGN